MDTFDKFLEFQKDLIQSQLKVIYRYQQQSPHLKKTATSSKVPILKKPHNVRLN